MTELKYKLYYNALHNERLHKLTPLERKAVILDLLDGETQRGLARKLGIPHSTIHDWASGRQNNTGEAIHISLSMIYRKISCLKAENITDWGRIEMIKDKCEELLKEKR